MAYDDVLHHIGGFGRYQKRIYFLLCLTVIPCAFHKLAGVFLGGKPKHRWVEIKSFCMFNISERHNNPKSHHPPHLLIILFILLFPLVAKKQVVIYIYTKSIRRKLTVSFLSKVTRFSKNFMRFLSFQMCAAIWIWERNIQIRRWYCKCKSPVEQFCTGAWKLRILRCELYEGIFQRRHPFKQDETLRQMDLLSSRI